MVYRVTIMVTIVKVSCTMVTIRNVVKTMVYSGYYTAWFYHGKPRCYLSNNHVHHGYNMVYHGAFSVGQIGSHRQRSSTGQADIDSREAESVFGTSHVTTTTDVIASLQVTCCCVTFVTCDLIGPLCQTCITWRNDTTA